MRVVDAYPPNIKAIKANFPFCMRKGVIFTYGNVIYAPHGVRVSAALKAHESVHSQRQHECGGPEEWWTRYIEDVKFRYSEELLAHRAEYRWFRAHKQSRAQRYALQDIATRLSSDLYGNMISVLDAQRALEQQGIQLFQYPTAHHFGPVVP